MLRFGKNVKIASFLHGVLTVILLGVVSPSVLLSPIIIPSAPAPAPTPAPTPVQASVFEVTNARGAIDALQAKLTALNNSSDMASAKTNLSALQSKIAAARGSQYASNSAVVSALATAQASYDALNAKLQLAPIQKNLDDLNTAYTAYAAAAGAQPFITDLNSAQGQADTSLAKIGASIDDAVKALQAAQAFFNVSLPGVVAPSFLSAPR